MVVLELRTLASPKKGYHAFMFPFLYIRETKSQCKLEVSDLSCESRTLLRPSRFQESAY